MVAPTVPTLYYFDDNVNTRLADLYPTGGNLAANAHAIRFEFAKDAKRQALFQLNGIDTFGDENTIDEPEISGGEKTLNKQNIGALPWGIKLTANITRGADGDAILKGLWSFYNQVQVQYPHRPFGIFSFYSATSEYFDVNSSPTIGFTMKAPVVNVAFPSTQMTVEIVLLLGGKNLVSRFP